MRKCLVFAVALFALFFLSHPGDASAQGIFLGGGITSPTGDYGDYADVGWMVEAGFNIPISDNGLYAFVDGLYGSNNHEIEGDKTNLLGAFGGLEYALESGLFVFGEVGLLKHSYKSDDFPEYEGDDTGFAFGGGVGYAFPIGNFTGWALGRYIQGQFDGEDGNTTFLGIMAGVTVPLGGDEG